ncbi:MAG: flagellar biosynthesis anti-sigma factor FlgM [Luminiphilus sp.]|jgi:negative regulator of flagellin synthesis FlgM|nr:flagellar biosynthesis anti-sigma factor FlgM [Luminiphilus sp.]
MPSVTETMRSAVPESTVKKDVRSDKAVSSDQSTAKAPQDVAPEATAPESAVALSESVTETIELAEFDAEKVEALRLAIMEGNYPLDAKRIAENMISLERMIG